MNNKYYLVGYSFKGDDPESIRRYIIEFKSLSRIIKKLLADENVECFMIGKLYE